MQIGWEISFTDGFCSMEVAANVGEWNYNPSIGQAVFEGYEQQALKNWSRSKRSNTFMGLFCILM
jgi:hypothetical protein